MQPILKPPIWRVNRGQRLSQRLAFYSVHPGGSNVWDAVSGQEAPSTATLVSGPYGRALNVTAEGTVAPTFSFAPIVGSSGSGFGDVTIAVVANPAASASAASALLSQRLGTSPFYHVGVGANLTLAQVVSGGSTSGVLTFLFYNNGSVYGANTSGSAVDGKWHVFVATLRNGVFNIYIDGVNNVSTSTAPNGLTFYNSGQSLRVGDLCQATDPTGFFASCAFALTAAWNRGLSFEEVLAFTRDPWLPLRPASTPVYTRVAPIVAVTLDESAAVEWLGTGASDAAGQIELYGTVVRDLTMPAEQLAFGAVLDVVPFESSSLDLASEGATQTEWLAFGKTDDQPLGEWGLVVRPDEMVAAERLALNVRDSVSPIELGLAVRSDRATPAEWGAAAIRDAPTPAEWTAVDVASDGGTQIEWSSSGIVSNEVVPIELGLAVRADDVVPVEWNSAYTALVADDAPSIEWAAALAAGGSSPAEWRGAPTHDTATPAEWLAGVKRDEFTVSEFYGEGVISDGNAPAEWLRISRADDPELTEWIGLLRADDVAPAENASLTIRDVVTPEEQAATIVRDVVAPAETTAALARDMTTPAEWGQGLLSDETDQVEWAATSIGHTIADDLAGMEWLGVVPASEVVPGENVSGLSLASISPAEGLARGAIDSRSVLEWAMVVHGDLLTPYEPWQPNSSSACPECDWGYF